MTMVESLCCNRLHKDELSQPFADSQSRVANQADEVGPVGEQPDDLILAQADFAQVILNLRSRAKPSHAHSHTCPHPTERAQFASRVFILKSAWRVCLSQIHVLSLEPDALRAHTCFAICRTYFVQLDADSERKKCCLLDKTGKEAFRRINQSRAMNTKTKILLGISLTSFLISFTGVLWGLFLPVGAIIFGLFLIFNLLGKESALFDEEQHLRNSLAEKNAATMPQKSDGTDLLSTAIPLKF